MCWGGLAIYWACLSRPYDRKGGQRHALTMVANPIYQYKRTRKGGSSGSSVIYSGPWRRTQMC